jgi:hypothetical protein
MWLLHKLRGYLFTGKIMGSIGEGNYLIHWP